VSSGHAYSLISAFTLNLADGTTADVLLLRNPWEEDGYAMDFSKNDARWTDALVA